MSHAALTAKYRPQTFADVAGQVTLKAILSRAALEEKVAPAYLFSGTRGVGKTTLARVFAKALNCRNAPASEPCNECDICRSITAGSAVDVVEIDGASNRGIDDVRRLKEVIGYAAMEGRYKVFIIDEAHMLSREAFNALLKTLEEPPARVTFIMATTEAHKFPATIISRCQHYVFKALTEKELVNHLSRILGKEHILFEEGAVRLLARRGAGSVRDSMSLLGQVLALGGNTLTVEETRNTLGLAGHEVFFEFLGSFQAGDCLRITEILRGMLDQGLDIGFFLRELASLWRNLFLLKQSGKAGLKVVDLPEDEAKALLDASEAFALSHIHASWQMTLEAQRRVLTSLEPALGLELLLLNLAMLPQLISLEGLSALGRKLPSPQGGGMPSGGKTLGSQARSTSVRQVEAQRESTALPQKNRGSFGQKESKESAADDDEEPSSANTIAEGQTETRQAEQEVSNSQKTPGNDAAFEGSDDTSLCDAESSLHEAPGRGGGSLTGSLEEERAKRIPEEISAEEDLEPDFGGGQKTLSQTKAVALGRGAEFSWDAFILALQGNNAPAWFLSLTQRVFGEFEGDILALRPNDSFTQQQFLEQTTRDMLDEYLKKLLGEAPSIIVGAPSVVRKDREVLKQEIFDNPVVQKFEETLGAKIFDFGQMR